MQQMFDENILKNATNIQSERLCVSCNRPIRDRYVMHVTPDLHWHDTCLSCSECGKRLDEKFTCFLRGGKTYCKEDFFRSRGIRCFKCHQPFGASDLVREIIILGSIKDGGHRNGNLGQWFGGSSSNGVDGERYEGIFHNECFTCSLCNKRVGAGEHYCLLKNGDIVCSKDMECSFTYNTVHSNTHQQPLIRNNSYHNCHNNLNEVDDDDERSSSSSSLNDVSHNVISSKQNDSCGKSYNCHSFDNNSISFNDNDSDNLSYTTKGHLGYVDSSNVISSANAGYFYDEKNIQNHYVTTTTTSMKGYNTNDNNISGNNSIGKDNELSDASLMLDKFDNAAVESFNSVNNNNNSNNSIKYNNISPTTTCTTHNNKFSPSSSSPSLLSTSCSATNNKSATGQHKSSQHSRNKHGDGVNISSGSSSVNKTTRVRTVLNEKQLHTLRTCYAANPRPDALMKDQLVEMTGLNSRVIRVWFQNKRCKDKKRTILIKQIQQHNQEKLKNMNMITAASPVPQNTSSTNNQSEVTTSSFKSTSLDVDKYLNPTSMTHSNADWSTFSNYSSPLFRIDGSDPMNSQYSGHVTMARHRTPPIQQLLNSFGSNRSIENEISNSNDFAAKSKLINNSNNHNMNNNNNLNASSNINNNNNNSNNSNKLVNEYEMNNHHHRPQQNYSLHHLRQHPHHNSAGALSFDGDLKLSPVE